MTSPCKLSSVWNLLGRRDNKYKARIKITVHEHGIEEISRLVEERFAQIAPTFGGVDQQMLKEIEAHFAAPAYATGSIAAYDAYRAANPAFRSWSDTNLAEHKNADYAIVSISLKAHGATPGDASSDQMRVMADLAEKFAHDELRISHEQNVILPHSEHRVDQRHHRLPWHGLLRARHRRAASMLVVTTMWVTSAFWASTVRVLRTTRSHLAATARKMQPLANGLVPVSARTRLSPQSNVWSWATSTCVLRPTRHS